MSPPTTSLQRTYRYLRLTLVGAVVAIFTAVAVAASDVGWLPSLSDYYYSPARTTFTGALLVAAAVLLALSGRGPERALLDACAVLAPLIALIPTPHIPPAALPDVTNGITTYLVITTLALIVAVTLTLTGDIPVAAVAASGSVAALVILTLGLAWMLAPHAVLTHGHVIATVAFFAVFGAVAILHAFPRTTAPPPRALRVIYTGIAALLGLVLIAYLTTSNVALLAESVALALFAVFWIVQSIEKWNDPDPSLR